LTGERVERRLAAVLAADVAGYSRLMGADEEGTLACLKTVRKALVDPAISSHHGRIVKTTGDGMLVEFASAVDAVRSAVEVQRSMAERNAAMPQGKMIQFRIGIHIGDIIIDDNDIFGDGVNIAAQLEGIAEPGGLCLSDDAYRQIRGKVDIVCNDLGPQTLKNIDEPMRAWRVQLGGQSSVVVKPASLAPTLALPDKPSIAVLPFQNMSGDPEQEYFADGMVEDIITALSRFGQLFVIARNSSFTYKGRAVDVKQVGRELGVRYVLEGSVRKAAKRVRITGQLIDATTGAHVWADRFEGGIEDIFDLQDQVTATVVGQLAPTLEKAEIERAKRKLTENLDAYDYHLRGLAKFYQITKQSTDDALALFHKAIELDPEFAAAYGMAARCYALRKINGWVTDQTHEVAEVTHLAGRAVELEKDDAIALCTAGFALAYVAGNIDFGAALVDRAISLNPNLAIAWSFGGMVRNYLGEPSKAIERFTQAKRLSPRDPVIHNTLSGLAQAYLYLGRYDEAASWADQAIGQDPNYLSSLRVAAASYALAGQSAKAAEVMGRLRKIDPALRLSNLQNYTTLRRPEDFASLAEGLRRAGLPE
jgi:TolB-like protein/class 3 adenylate cyclase